MSEMEVVIRASKPHVIVVYLVMAIAMDIVCQLANSPRVLVSSNVGFQV